MSLYYYNSATPIQSMQENLSGLLFVVCVVLKSELVVREAQVYEPRPYS